MFNKLPNFLVVGGMKTGTTSLPKNLNYYPDIFLLDGKTARNTVLNNTNINPTLPKPEIMGKEIGFFDKHYEHGKNFYRSFFNTNKTIVGECAANYLYNHESVVIDRIVETLGKDIKIIILIRDPITRAYSHWNHAQQTNHSWASTYKNKTFEDSLNIPNSNLVIRSLQYKHITKWIEVFGYDNIFVGVQEEMLNKPLHTHNQIAKFLGAKILETPPPFKKIHQREYKEKLPPHIVSKYKYLFSNDVKNLKKLYPNLNYEYWFNY